MGFLDSIKKLFGKKEEQTQDEPQSEPAQAPAEEAGSEEEQPM